MCVVDCPEPDGLFCGYSEAFANPFVVACGVTAEVCIIMLRCVEALGVHIVIRNLSTLHLPIGGWLQH